MKTFLIIIIAAFLISYAFLSSAYYIELSTPKSTNTTEQVDKLEETSNSEEEEEEKYIPPREYNESTLNDILDDVIVQNNIKAKIEPDSITTQDTLVKTNKINKKKIIIDTEHNNVNISPARTIAITQYSSNITKPTNKTLNNQPSFITKGKAIIDAETGNQTTYLIYLKNNDYPYCFQELIKNDGKQYAKLKKVVYCISNKYITKIEVEENTSSTKVLNFINIREINKVFNKC